MIFWSRKVIKRTYLSLFGRNFNRTIRLCGIASFIITFIIADPPCLFPADAFKGSIVFTLCQFQIDTSRGTIPLQVLVIFCEPATTRSGILYLV
jgi:hypothetical protein